MKKSGVVEVLLIEDDDADVELVRILLDSRADLRLTIEKNGQSALSYLQTLKADHQPLPGLILLDINLPGRNGFEILDEIKADPTLKVIPVVVMSSSGFWRDIFRAYESYANSYIQKAVDFEEFKRKMTVVLDYWFSATALPTHQSTELTT